MLETRQPRQLHVSYNLTFSAPHLEACRLLDPWLNRIFDHSVEDLLPTKLPVSAGDTTLPAQWLHRCLLLAMELLRIGRIPVFDPPRILACAPSAVQPQKWSAVVALPLVDLISRAVYDLALKTSFQLCAWAATTPFNEDNVQRFDATILKQVIQPLSEMQLMGKSTLPLLQEAHAAGIPFIHLGGGVFQLGWGSKSRRVDRSTTDLDSAIGSKLAQSKVYTAALLRMAGLPAPVHAVVDNREAALAAARGLGWPLVVKPADRDRGEGVAVDVVDEVNLATCFDEALKRSQKKQVIVEQQVEGVCHRLFIANGKLLYAVKRLPLSVAGDGRHSIAELVAAACLAEQRRPLWKRSEIKPLDDLARAAIKAAGYSETSVPKKDELVPLRRIESTAWGGINQEVTQDVHQENLRIALAAADLFNLNVAGVDLITPDVNKPWYDTGAIINEVNFAPLLGGREVSRQYVRPFLEDLVTGKGLVPVEVFSGGTAALEAALGRQRSLAATGLRCVLAGHQDVLTVDGEAWRTPFTENYYRVRALVLSAQVDAIVLVVQTDEFLNTGLPLEYVDRVEFVDNLQFSSSSPDTRLTAERHAELVTLLESWVVN